MFLYTDWRYILSVKVALLLKIEYTIYHVFPLRSSIYSIIIFEYRF